MRRMPIVEALDLTSQALKCCGAVAEVADPVALSCVDAQCEGLHGVGMAHAVDYCESLLAGRVNGRTTGTVSRPAPTMFHCDADEGFPHVAFDEYFDDLVASVKTYGLALYTSQRGYTSGALGYYVRRLAEMGFVAQAATNAGPPAVAPSGATKPVFATNPLAFSVPTDPPAVIDQSSSQAALVNLRLAIEANENIPEGWALDCQGNPTLDPAAALSGVLLAFGGNRGANVALMVELMAAGLTGSNWSVDAPSFIEGEKSPGVGLAIIAIDPTRLLGDRARDRFNQYIQRISQEFGAYIPGHSRHHNRLMAEQEGLEVDEGVVARLQAFANNAPAQA